MTFSIVGHCARSGEFGIAIATSSIAVGARCAHVRAGVGAAASQNVTDPALGSLLLDLMQRGIGAKAALAAVVGERPGIEHRQLAVVDAQGRTAVWSGAHMLGLAASAETSRAAAAGNLLGNETVPAAMARAFDETAELTLGERLLRALEAGLAAGGEVSPVRSAALKIAREATFPYVDLRVDWSEAPLVDLRRLWLLYQPQAEAYLKRAMDPAGAPGF
jgi:uncharacterized Ntn-hydrolase superfamily protein